MAVMVKGGSNITYLRGLLSGMIGAIRTDLRNNKDRIFKIMSPRGADQVFRTRTELSREEKLLRARNYSSWIVLKLHRLQVMNSAKQTFYFSVANKPTYKEN